MSFLDLEDKWFFITGVSNKKSVAYAIAQEILTNGGRVVFSVEDFARQQATEKLFPGHPVFICRADHEAEILSLPDKISAYTNSLSGFVHSIAFANYSEGIKPFHETKRSDFMQALDISMFSLVAMSNSLKSIFSKTASVVTISISHTNLAAESYGYMAPIKAALDSSITFLAKSFSSFSEVRFNSINAGLLKTSASAGIPGYLDNYLFAELATLRKSALKTQEVANLAVFLLSSRSSGINGQRHVIDAGMSVNFFDQTIVKKATAL